MILFLAKRNILIKNLIIFIDRSFYFEKKSLKNRELFATKQNVTL